jgi:hypothetical protein
MSGPSSLTDAVNRRREFRHTTPLQICIQGERVECVNWSLGGFFARGFARPLRSGDAIVGIIEVAGKSGPFSARVLRCDPARRELGVCFTRLHPEVAGELGRIASAARLAELSDAAE